MGIFLSLSIIFGAGVLGGFLFEKIRLPKLVWYIVLGILIGPSLFNVVDETLISISSYFRQVALVIILTRSGLSLDLKSLRRIGRPAILMCFVPACFEIAGVTIFAPLLLGVSYLEALLLGSVLAAVSPAIVVPRMIRMMEQGYGKKHAVPELVMAGASCDDIFVIVLFYSFKNLVATSKFDFWGIASIPVSIVSGIALGVVLGLLMLSVIKYLRLSKWMNVVLMLGLSLGSLALEAALKPYFSVSSLLSIIVMALLVSLFKKEEAKEIQKAYNGLWQGFEILLFVLVGVATDVRYAFSREGAIILGLVFIALVFRSGGVLLSVMITQYTWKERLYIVISYLPKATVQASIGAIALSEGLPCGTLVLTAAVVSILVTAPLGAILMDNLHKLLLSRDGGEEPASAT